MRISDWSSDVCSSDLSPVSCAPSKCGGKIDMASSHTDIIVDQVLELDPATIDVPGRVGLFFPEKAEAYAALIARDGQRTPITRSEERRVGKECVSTCRSRWSPSHETKTEAKQH